MITYLLYLALQHIKKTGKKHFSGAPGKTTTANQQISFSEEYPLGAELQPYIAVLT